MTRLFTCIATLLVTTALAAQPRAGYYSPAKGTKGYDLKTALAAIVGPHTDRGYDALWTAYKTTDRRPDGTVWDIYSNTTRYNHDTDHKGNYKKEGDIFNREHTVPQSWFNKQSPMRNDVFHVYPSDGFVNNKRDNYPFGEVGTAIYESNNGFCKLGSSKTPGYSGTVFEPADEFKGDIARTYFYMATAYESRISTWKSPMMSGNANSAYAEWAIRMLLKWAQQDPVSQKEIDRNNAAERFQGNRNPYIDFPGLEQYVWGEKKAVAFDPDHYDGGSVTPQPEPEPEPQPEAGIIYANDFSNNADGWNIVNTNLAPGLTYVWKHNPKYGNWNASAYINKTKTKYAAEAWIVSPEIALTKAAVLSFDHFQRHFADLSSEQTLWIRVKGGAWQQLSIPNTTPAADATNTTNNNFIASGDIRLDAPYVGQTVEIGFKYVSTSASASTWRIKNFKIKADPTAVVVPLRRDEPADVYDLSGRCVRRKVSSADLRHLPAGIYVVGGRKVSVP